MYLSDATVIKREFLPKLNLTKGIYPNHVLAINSSDPVTNCSTFHQQLRITNLKYSLSKAILCKQRSRIWLQNQEPL